ncbi:putative phosphatidylglycerol/phosphatidylinositol transfer protein DDB_G0282179 [Phoenix dactylifera]|uniref:Phosphatidylglycerol/phosphatidylinositol transfer protein DDB_G0282179 n=1 Tax=Phoenix dactylifera TaxID=42345 RepID=A0A8B8ZA72_PHODC|nr:putative phosphatidylglycerol/phosphatidylinositol transfer protein DDB_G0282179 [Phoenix dactylifera]XP_038970187.1 putative phosphatidylglycerol/phosphatidylinositol transfer protein DDB_G0282179 [Phoenix dactylifera]
MEVMAARFGLLPALFLAFCLLFSSAALASSVEYCKKGADYAVKVSGVDISPDPIARGKPATFTISAYTVNAITEGKLVINVKYFGLNVYEETHDLCKETSCPVSTGAFKISHKQTLPIFTPPGSYTLRMTMMGEDGKQLTCITFDFYIGFFSSVADI